MNNFFTKSGFEDEVRKIARKDDSSDAQKESRDFSKAPAGAKTIFLSHSHLDSKYVNVARRFFENQGIAVYVDWADKSMPTITCGETAELIKEKIKSNDFFVLLATEKALNSKWCNWEVGIGDTCKLADDKFVILPLEEDNRLWRKSEYLQLYPRIEKPDASTNISSGSYKVVYPDGKEKLLKSWLNQ